MVIGSRFNQFIPSKCVMSFLCVMSIVSGVTSPLYSIFAHFFQKFDLVFVHVLVSFLQRLEILLFVYCWVVWHYCYRGSGVDCEVPVFSIDFNLIS